MITPDKFNEETTNLRESSSDHVTRREVRIIVFVTGISFFILMLIALGGYAILDKKNEDAARANAVASCIRGNASRIEINNNRQDVQAVAGTSALLLSSLRTTDPANQRSFDKAAQVLADISTERQPLSLRNCDATIR